MTKRKTTSPGFLEEAERIERDEIQIPDDEAEGRWVFVRPRPAMASQVYSIRLPVTVVDDLRALASAKGEAPTALIREWVLDRMGSELDRLPSEGKAPASGGGKPSPRVRKQSAKGVAARKVSRGSGRTARTETIVKKSTSRSRGNRT